MASNINYSLREFGFGDGMSCISFLPLSHVTARSVDLGLLYRGVTLAHLPQIDQLPQALREVRPDILLSVPRVYEKVHSQVVLNAAKFPKKQIYRWAIRVGRAHRNEILAGKTPRSSLWKLANKLVFSKVRAGIGGRVEFFISGGAPLGRELAEWYADIGIRIHEGYGLTETSPVIAVNTPNAHRVGSVGKPLKNVEVRIADDGEILVRGPSVFRSYWNKPQETRDAFVDDWFKTGDIGRLDEDGFLYVTDRKKDLLKTSGGKFIAPQPIESSLKHHPWVAEAIVIGDKRKFPAVLLIPNFPAVETYARMEGLAFSTRNELIATPQVHAHFAEIVRSVNEDLAQFERLKKFRLIPEELSPANGTLTASMKIRRRAIEERFKREIEEMYSEREVASVT
jgi:long-chain acyl-CoA synthetase